MAFEGTGDDVFGEMVGALRAGSVDAVVDDDVVTVPLGADPDFEVAFTVATGNRWGVAVDKRRPELRDELSAAIRAASPTGAWPCVGGWLTELPFPDRLTHGL